MRRTRLTGLGLRLALLGVILRLCVAFVPFPVVVAAEAAAGEPSTSYVLICSVHGPMKVALGSDGVPTSNDGGAPGDLCPVCSAVTAFSWAAPALANSFSPPAVTAEKLRIAEHAFQRRETRLRATARAPPFQV